MPAWNSWANALFEKKIKLKKQFQEIDEILPLGFGKCRLSIAVPTDFPYESILSLDGKVIATSYYGLLSQFLKQKGVNAQIVTMEGAVEVALDPPCGCGM